MAQRDAIIACQVRWMPLGCVGSVTALACAASAARRAVICRPVRVPVSQLIASVVSPLVGQGVCVLHEALVLRQPMHMGERGVQSYAHTLGYRSTCIGTQRLFHVTGASLISVQYDAQCSVVCSPCAKCSPGLRSQVLYAISAWTVATSGPSQEAHTALRRCVAESHLVSAHYVPPAGAHRTWQRRGSIRWSQRPASLTLQRQPQLRYSPHL